MILPEMSYLQRKLLTMFLHVGLPSPLFSDGTPVHIGWRKIRYDNSFEHFFKVMAINQNGVTLNSGGCGALLGSEGNVGASRI